MDVVLVERDPFLDPLLGWVPDADTASGRLVLLGGEAGVGKTALVGWLVARVAGAVEVRRGFCDPVATPSPLGPVVDALPALADAVEAATLTTRPRLFREIRARLARAPGLLVLEDVHWADEATLDLLRFLGRRLDGLPLLVVATFRDDANGPGDPLTGLLGDLAGLPQVDRMHLPPLSVPAVAGLVAAATSPLDAADLHHRTGGNPFFVTEVLASPSTQAPSTVRDAVLARVGRLSRAAADALGAAAVLGPGAPLSLVSEVAGESAGAVDECVRRGMLVADPDDQGLSFRHEIARETVVASLPPSALTRFHERALAALTRTAGADEHRLAHHAAGCGRREEAVGHSLAAAAGSARLGAHREAASAYRSALGLLEPHDRTRAAAVQDLLSYECYLTNALDEAFTARRQALEIHQGLAPGSEAVGADQRWLSRLAWFLGRGPDAQRYADLAVATLEPLPPGHELAMALSNQSQLAMLAGRVTDTLDWGGRALALARSIGDRDVECHALNNVGTTLLGGSDPVAGVARLHQSLDIALTDDLHEHAARAYTNLGAGHARGWSLAEAEAELTAGIAYCSEHDLDSWVWYMSAWLATVRLEQGRYASAASLAGSVTRRPATPSVSRIPALVVAATVAVREGRPGVGDLLDRAHDLALGTGETQRILPVALARAEAAWTAGDLATAATELAVLDDVADGLEPWDGAVRHWWAGLVGADVPTPVDLPEPFALMAAGSWAGAAAGWERLGCPWWQGVCLSRSGSVDDARAGLERLAGIGAGATRTALLRERRRAGQSVPRERRPQTRANAGGLTARELEVLTLLCEGLSNARLAERLFLSTKTVDHHVSAVLRKLDAPNRGAAAATARRRGLVPNMGTTPDVDH